MFSAHSCRLVVFASIFVLRCAQTYEGSEDLVELSDGGENKRTHVEELPTNDIVSRIVQYLNDVETREAERNQKEPHKTHEQEASMPRPGKKPDRPKEDNDERQNLVRNMMREVIRLGREDEDVLSRDLLGLIREETRQTTNRPQSYGVDMDKLASFHPAGVLRPGQATFDDQCATVTSVPATLRSAQQIWPGGLHTFYQKYTHAYGIPILGSSNVTNTGLQRACYVVRYLLASRYDIRNAYYKLYGRVALIGDGEQQTSLPEYSTWDPNYWNTRARGLGPTIGIPLVSVGDDNLRAAASDRYWDQDILVHEFSHGVNLLSAAFVIQGFARQLGEAFRTVTASGKWVGTYGGTNPMENYAWGAQWYFNAFSPRACPQPGGGTYTVNNRGTLRTYDPVLTSLLDASHPCDTTSFILRGSSSQNYQQVIPSLCTTGPDPARCTVPSSAQKQCGPTGTTSANCPSIGCCWTGTSCVYPVQDCIDLSLDCVDNALSGACHTNPGYMYQTCPFSCGRCQQIKTLAPGALATLAQCSDSNGNCPGWASGGQCTANPAYMGSNCKLSCGKCSATDPFP